MIRHSRSTRRPATRPLRALVTVAALAALPVASGCAAGRDAQTSRAYQATEAVSASHNGIEIRNLFVLGPAPGQTLQVGSAVPVYLSLINNTNAPERLVAVSAPGLARPAQLQGGVDLPSRQLVSPGQAGSASPSPITLQGLATQLRGGEWRPLTLEFQQAGLITVNVPVVPARDSYLTYAPAPPPTTPSATPGGTPGSTPEPGESRTPRPRGSRSPSPTPTPTDTGR